MQQLALALNEFAWEAHIATSDMQIDYSKYTLMHLFNAARPADLLKHIHYGKLPVVVSPVYVDYSVYEQKHRVGIGRLASRIFNSSQMEYLKVLARAVINGEVPVSREYLINGHISSVQKVLRKSALLMPQSESEIMRVKRDFGYTSLYKVVYNGIVTEEILQAKATPNEIARGAVVIVGRIEGRKNQLSLIRAVRGLGIRLLIIGRASPNHRAYAAQCRAEADDSVTFLGQLPHHEVLRILAAARVHVLPSHFETCGLSSLEAAALGTRIVVGDRGDVRDYFGDNAVYCDPDSVDSIRAAVVEALNTPAPVGFAEHVREHLTWAKAAEQTAEAYESVLRAV